MTQGPSKPVGGQYLNSCELDKKREIQEREGKKQQALSDYQKKQRRLDYQQGERERKDREMQEKKDQARELANKQTRRENDRNLAHDQVVIEQRLSHFTQYQQLVNICRSKVDYTCNIFRILNILRKVVENIHSNSICYD